MPSSPSIFLHHCKFLTLSFSGAGHLLAYHLGVAVAVRTNEQTIAKPIHAVSGSSSGAIAATAFAYFSQDRIEKYADAFISDGGGAMKHFKRILGEIEWSDGDEEVANANNASLHVATTRCSDGSLRLFNFPPKLSSIPDQNHLVKCLEASCKIPRHFHPSDVLQSILQPTYSDVDGIAINGGFYVDGGISAPAPPTPLDSMEGALRVVVSPISGPAAPESNSIRISPKDTSWKFPLDFKCRGGFAVHPSVQNIRALQVSAGVASPAILKEWFEKGYKDGTKMLTV